MYNLYMSATPEPEELTASAARQGFADVVGRAQHAGATTYIVKHGRRVAAVVPIEAAELLERIDDEYWSARAREALDEPGPNIPHEELARELGDD
jgi:prevent-host-death family protein